MGESNTPADPPNVFDNLREMRYLADKARLVLPEGEEPYHHDRHPGDPRLRERLVVIVNLQHFNPLPLLNDG